MAGEARGGTSKSAIHFEPSSPPPACVTRATRIPREHDANLPEAEAGVLREIATRYLTALSTIYGTHVHSSMTT